ncbi:MAG: AraC family transcriptional regulator [Lewinella sp.]|nr:AraC family transcriptional regulator [Lewinella sp.]
MLKSVLYLFEGAKLSLPLMNLGFAAHLGAASALYLYFLIHRRSGSIPRFEVVLHLLPPIAITLASPWLHLQSFWYLGGYHCLLIASVIYWAWAVKLFFDIRRERVQVFQQKKQWWISVLAGTGIFFLAYFSNYVLGVLPYAQAPFFYSFAVFCMGYSAWRNFANINSTDEPQPQKKYRNLSLTKTEMEQGKMIILRALEQDQLFLEPDCSLQQLSERTQIPSHVLSLILNQHLNTNFTTLINSYRIETACHLLLRPDRQHYTIAAIAFEAGFSSLSVFNRHFRAQKGMTPSAFRKKNLS